jgi:hypothetical protein
VIGKLLGHTQPATTARYAHLSADPIRAANNLIGAAITAAMGINNQRRRVRIRDARPAPAAKNIVPVQ